MERDELFNARDLAYHMTEEDYEDMMFNRSFNDGLDGDDYFDDEEDFDDGEFDRFEDDFDDDDYVEDDFYSGWDNDIEQGRWDE